MVNKRKQNLVSPDAGGSTSKSPKRKGVCKNYVHAGPAYLETLGQTHCGWIFGAIAEIVDNSKDARATKLDISVEYHHSGIHGEKIPMLALIDDGHGMSHDELLVMLSLGNKKFHEDDRERIGKYGVGFKTGAMKLGRDVIVLTQTTESRSVAFLSQTYNESNKDDDLEAELELPIVSYHRIGSVMKLDTNVQSEQTSEYNLDILRRFSPFNEYFIGAKFALFGENGQGTQVYIWNLEKSGSDFSLEWHRSNNGDDIVIRSRRTRQRPGQLAQRVPLDYSLRAYLEVIFLDPRMKIFIQGSLIIDGNILGKPVQLILGHSQQEWERMNSGIFLYWHGRLIEAYKRVGGMIQHPENSRGVIGVVDVTDVMHVGDRDMVNNTKQTFQECKPYAELEDWLGGMLDMYCRENSEASEGGSSANSERPHVRFNIPRSPKQPAAKKSLNSAGRNTTNTSNVGPKLPAAEKAPRCSRSEDDSSSSSERPRVVHNVPKVPKAKRGRPKLPAAKKASNYARRNSTATTTSNSGSKLPAAKKSAKWATSNSTSTINVGLQGCEANLGFRKRFTRSCLYPPNPK
ncbi:hypothetical protein MKW98_032290 [Papaver atlanticum]|uniref:Morc S5 domain-containing protein n=1 Tax=Papaver atlanticum TaxID=357466 RepID=A0AAD4SET5_9MAGN|nr:hypothetical protein MKW98_032290 [Papaver atlanticum]